MDLKPQALNIFVRHVGTGVDDRSVFGWARENPVHQNSYPIGCIGNGTIALYWNPAWLRAFYTLGILVF